MVLGFSNLRSQDLPDLGRRAQVIPAGATMAESGWSVGPLPVHWPQTAFWEARGTAFVVACQPFAPSTLTHSAGQEVDGCLASQGSEPLTHPGRRSLRVILRSISVARLCAFASFLEPGRWPSAFPGATGGKLLQALDGCRQHAPFGLQLRDDPVEVHVKPPSGAGQRIRASTVNLGGSGSSSGSTARLSS